MRWVLLGLLALSTVSCRPHEKWFDAKVKVVESRVIHKNEGGKPLTMDVTFLWQCPGTQLQSVRTDPNFAACISKTKPGEVLPVRVKWEWNDFGYYDWHVTKLGECDLPEVEEDDSTWEAVAECIPVVEHGASVGFHCDREPEGALVKECPWFRRR